MKIVKNLCFLKEKQRFRNTFFENSFIPLYFSAENEKATFETAITATGFGKFNIFLLLATLPTCWSSIFQLTTISYVFPAAQCDLSLSLEDKGMLSAATFAGKCKIEDSTKTQFSFIHQCNFHQK